MFQATQNRPSHLILNTLELIYHSIVRDVRKGHKNAVIGMLMNMVQTVIMVLAFYAMFWILPGARRGGIPGDFIIYLMTGIFLFMAHTKAVGAVVKSEGPGSSMMQHAPLNAVVTISAAALGSLYNQILSISAVLLLYHLLINPVVIDQPIGTFGMFLASWFSGVGVGCIFLAIKPWFPELTTIGASVYSRVNMVASGKMFVANSLPPSLLMMFDWNPLFHTIDQSRGFVFRNYSPHFSSLTYPIWVGMGLLVIGMMAQFYTRKTASISWSAGR